MSWNVFGFEAVLFFKARRDSGCIVLLHESTLSCDTQGDSSTAILEPIMGVGSEVPNTV